VLTERLVRATHRQVPELVAWADELGNDDRIWAVESAGGLGYLLAQQLLAAGETVVDIPATLASRVRLLGSGRSDKNDSNDARSVAIAALRAPRLVPVRVEDHATVLRLLSRRHTQLAWARNKTACRLHALVTDLVPGGISKRSSERGSADLGAVFRPRSALCHAGRAVSVGAFWDAASSTDGPVSDLGTFLGRIAS
jgi:transposase